MQRARGAGVLTYLEKSTEASVAEYEREEREVMPG